MIPSNEGRFKVLLLKKRAEKSSGERQQDDEDDKNDDGRERKDYVTSQLFGRCFDAPQSGSPVFLPPTEE